MKRKKTYDPEAPKPDLKHDTMEFSAATDGDDRLDLDDERYEEEEITAEELEILEEDDIDGQVAALVSAELDRDADDDNLPDEDWEDDLPDEEEEDDEQADKKHPRK